MWRRLTIWLLSLWGVEVRAIFRYWDGKRYRWIDPITACRGLYSHPTFLWSRHPKECESDNARQAFDAFAITAQAVRDVFRIKPLDAGGLTEEECFRLLLSFEDYLGTVKKNISQTPTSPPVMEFPPTEESAMNSESECGSTSIEKACEPVGL